LGFNKTSPDEMKEILGFAHFTFKVGSEENVNLFETALVL